MKRSGLLLLALWPLWSVAAVEGLVDTETGASVDPATQTELEAAAPAIGQYDIAGRLSSGSGPYTGVAAGDLTEEATPAAGDFVVGWESGGALRKFDIGDFPGGSGGSVAWDDVTDKPSTFAPSAHAASHADGGADEVALDASQITSGTVASARLPATWTYSAQTPTSGTIAGASGTWYRIGLGSASADTTLTVPACAAGERMAVEVTSTNATYELVLTAAAGTTLQGVAAGTEWTRIWQVGELVVGHCVAANTWLVEHDGRIPSRAAIRRTTGTLTTSGTANTFTPVDADAADALFGPGRGDLVVSGTPYRIGVRRSGVYRVLFRWGISLTDGASAQAALYTAGGTLAQASSLYYAAANLATDSMYSVETAPVMLTAGTAYEMRVRTNLTSRTVAVSVGGGPVILLEEVL